MGTAREEGGGGNWMGDWEAVGEQPGWTRPSGGVGSGAGWRQTPSCMVRGGAGGQERARQGNGGYWAGERGHRSRTRGGWVMRNPRRRTCEQAAGNPWLAMWGVLPQDGRSKGRVTFGAGTGGRHWNHDRSGLSGDGRVTDEGQTGGHFAGGGGGGGVGTSGSLSAPSANGGERGGPNRGGQ